MTRVVVQVRVSEEEKAAWWCAAGDVGMSEWMRTVLNAAAKKEVSAHQPAMTAVPTMVMTDAEGNLQPPPKLCAKCARQVRIGGKADDGCPDCNSTS